MGSKISTAAIITTRSRIVAMPSGLSLPLGLGMY
jgi:hypothetical protein